MILPQLNETGSSGLAELENQLKGSLEKIKQTKQSSTKKKTLHD